MSRARAEEAIREDVVHLANLIIVRVAYLFICKKHWRDPSAHFLYYLGVATCITSYSIPRPPPNPLFDDLYQEKGNDVP